MTYSLAMSKTANIFSIATWNINSVRLRAGLVEHFLKTYQPDVLCLQETKCIEDNFPRTHFAKIGYGHHAIAGQKGYHGVAILSRLPLENISRTDFCDMGDARHIEATVKLAGKAFKIHSVYVPAGGDEPDPTINPKFDHKLKFLSEIEHKLRSDASDYNLLLGDLNVAPYEQDVWSHKQLLKVVSHTPVETELFEKVRQAAGWQDITRQYIPIPEKLYTWWSYRAKDWEASNRGRRLDHIWSCKPLSEKVKSVSILKEARGWEKPSDHVPLIAKFEI
jgi:exodeoxyribonuclease-3